MSWNYTLPENDAQNIRMAAKAVVFDSLPYWDFTLKPEAAFTSSIEELKVQFSSTSVNYDQIIWDFGDGAFSEEENPVHFYEQGGSYEVKLHVSSCEFSDDYSETIEVSENMGVKPSDFLKIVLFPNPVKDKLTIQFKKQPQDITIEIMDLNSRVIHSEKKLQTLNIDFSSFPTGIYFVKFKNERQQQIKRVIKK